MSIHANKMLHHANNTLIHANKMLIHASSLLNHVNNMPNHANNRLIHVSNVLKLSFSFHFTNFEAYTTLKSSYGFVKPTSKFIPMNFTHLVLTLVIHFTKSILFIIYFHFTFKEKYVKKLNI